MSAHDTPPAVELHVHVEGTLEPELILELADRGGVALPYADLDDLRARVRLHRPRPLPRALLREHGRAAHRRGLRRDDGGVPRRGRRPAGSATSSCSSTRRPTWRAGCALEAVARGGLGGARRGTRRPDDRPHPVLPARPARSRRPCEVLDALVRAGVPLLGRRARLGGGRPPARGLRRGLRPGPGGGAAPGRARGRGGPGRLRRRRARRARGRADRPRHPQPRRPGLVRRLAARRRAAHGLPAVQRAAARRRHARRAPAARGCSTPGSR